MCDRGRQCLVFNIGAILIYITVLKFNRVMFFKVLDVHRLLLAWRRKLGLSMLIKMGRLSTLIHSLGIKVSFNPWNIRVFLI